MDSIVKIGQPAPDFSLPALDGKIYRLNEWRGRVVVLDFWSAECPWSKRGDDELSGYLPGWGESVALWRIASNANEPEELLRRVAEERRLPLVLQDAQQTVADLYVATTTPHLFVIDAQGILCYQGSLDDTTFRKRLPTQFYLRQAVEALLAGRRPDPAETEPYGCTIVRHIPDIV
jgi:hypothetical protein